ncbi:MAG: SRPBCC family protein [Myxococcota bacterium]|nr:SRPBCC family protein [Myxococcota bacterium]MEC8425485.1 SRPBCC family protein [Myxococcota bacterium]
MDVSATADQGFSVPASPDAAFALVADVPDSVSHFPGIDGFEAAGPDAWRWTLATLGSGRLQLQTVYTCRYSRDAQARTVRWVAADAPSDNARVEGTWTITPEGTGTRLRLTNTLTIDVPVPRVMRRPAEALVSHENNRLIAEYIDNLKTTLSGGDGRVR